MEVRNFPFGLSDRTVRTVVCAAGLLLLSSAGCFVYLRLRRRSHPPPDEPLQAAAHDSIIVLEVPENESGVLQVTESNLLLPELLPEESALILLSMAGELSRTTCIFQCLSGESYSSKSESVKKGRYFLCLGRGSEVQLWFFSITETCRVNHLGFTYYTGQEISITGIQRIHGKVTELISCCRLETFINVPLEDCVQTFQEVTHNYLRVQPDDHVVSHQWVKEDTFCTSDWDSVSQSDSESSEVNLSPEEIEVPSISSHLAESGITDVFLKLQALREAFSIVLSSVRTQNLLYVAGKNLVKHLAAANKQDVVRVQLAYESLIRFLRSPSNQEAIKAELLEAEIQHLNFVDVIFELIFFRWIMSDFLPEISSGGLLEQLFFMIKMWDIESWEAAAEQFFALLVLQVLSFLGMIFSQPLDLYSDPAALATVVLDLLKEQLQVLTTTMKEI